MQNGASVDIWDIIGDPIIGREKEIGKSSEGPSEGNFFLFCPMTSDFVGFRPPFGNTCRPKGIGTQNTSVTFRVRMLQK